MPQWTVSTPEKITFQEPLQTLQVRILAGAVHVVAADGPARLEVAEVQGPPLLVTLDGGILTITYEDLRWQDFSLRSLASRLQSWRRRRRAVVSLAVPAETRVELGSVNADAVVSGVAGPVTVRAVSGDTTLVRISGPVEADSLSGSIDAQSVSGDLRVNTVSGDVTVVEGAAPRLRANSVGGGITVDLRSSGPADVHLKTVSGEVAVRVPDAADTLVEADTTSGQVSSAFDELRLNGTWGSKRLSGRLGAGTGNLQVTTVSGSVALLRRPPTAEAQDTEGAQSGEGAQSAAPLVDLGKGEGGQDA
jgi:hypothetical protein